MRRYYGNLYGLTKHFKFSIVDRLKYIISNTPLHKKFSSDSDSVYVLLHISMRSNKSVLAEPSVVELAT